MTTEPDSTKNGNHDLVVVGSSEELQAANEEFEATNEELQATNEELETNNEELQATNEELQTTNDELTARTFELQDFSRQHKAEQLQLSALLERFPHYVMVVDAQNLIIETINPGYKELLGEREVVDLPLSEVFTGKDVSTYSTSSEQPCGKENPSLRHRSERTWQKASPSRVGLFTL